MRSMVDAEERRSVALPLAGLVVLAPLVAAYLAFRYARKLHQTSTRDLADDPPPGALRALGYATLASAIPGVALLLLPTIVVALTGAFIMPAFAFARDRLLEERRQLGA
ncbi:hypothetical protein WMF38_47250 [Sorangium sp. So ce118]